MVNDTYSWYKEVLLRANDGERRPAQLGFEESNHWVARRPSRHSFTIYAALVDNVTNQLLQQGRFWSVMNVEPVICACGDPVSGGGDDIASVLFSPMCNACIRITYHEAGRLCDRCIHNLNTQHPGVRFAV